MSLGKMIAMSGTTELGSQLKELLAGLSGHGHQHLAEAEKDLAQTTVLLSEAIEKLGASFMGIHDAVCRQQREIDELLARHPESTGAAERLKAMQGEIGAHVNSAVTGLQFQDMTSQLIDRTLLRVGGIRNVLDTLGANGLAGLRDSDATEISALVASINATLGEQGAKLQGLLQKSVSQTHMNSGDVELF
jgi:hypothetical protein